MGSVLQRQLIVQARQDGYHVMVAGVDAENAAPLRFHERLGFVQVAQFRQVDRKFGRWLDLVFLQRLLDDETL